MSDCPIQRIESIEAFAFGELDAPATDAMRDHLATCVICARELTAVRAERSAMFALERSIRDAALPDFEDVLRRAVAGPLPEAPKKRRFPAVSLSAAAAMLFVVLRTMSGGPAASHHRAPDSNSGEMTPIRSAFEPNPDQTISWIEESEHACLLASPASRSNDRICGESSAVTASLFTPLHREACE